MKAGGSCISFIINHKERQNGITNLPTCSLQELHSSLSSWSERLSAPQLLIPCFGEEKEKQVDDPYYFSERNSRKELLHVVLIGSGEIQKTRVRLRSESVMGK